MQNLLRRAKEFGIGVRPLDENDFYRICEKERIEIIWSDEPYSFYFSSFDRSFIVLPKRLHGLKLLFAAYHEFGHALASAGVETTALWQNMPHEEDENEADAIALVAIIPKHYVGRTDFLDMYPRSFAKKIYNERLKLYFLHGV